MNAGCGMVLGGVCFGVAAGSRGVVENHLALSRYPVAIAGFDAPRTLPVVADRER
jgi:hypothetical protein